MIDEPEMVIIAPHLAAATLRTPEALTQSAQKAPGRNGS
jgi:hypothetical protein